MCNSQWQVVLILISRGVMHGLQNYTVLKVLRMSVIQAQYQSGDNFQQQRKPKTRMYIAFDLPAPTCTEFQFSSDEQLLRQDEEQMG